MSPPRATFDPYQSVASVCDWHGLTSPAVTPHQKVDVQKRVESRQQRAADASLQIALEQQAAQAQHDREERVRQEQVRGHAETGARAEHSMYSELIEARKFAKSDEKAAHFLQSMIVKSYGNQVLANICTASLEEFNIETAMLESEGAQAAQLEQAASVPLPSDATPKFRRQRTKNAAAERAERKCPACSETGLTGDIICVECDGAGVISGGYYASLRAKGRPSGCLTGTFPLREHVE